MQKMIDSIFKEHQTVFELTSHQLPAKLETACKLAIETIASGNKIMLCGNGGSAADAQHIASEFSGRFVKKRKGLPAIALTTDTSALTAITNDFGFETVFARQVEALAQEGDLLIGISTSGTSPNILSALKTARAIGCKTIGFSGNDGGSFKDLCDLNLIVPSHTTARIQEMHILFGHIICSAIDDAF